LAELTVSAYRTGDSFLHHLDIRVKIASLVLISGGILGASPVVLGVFTLVFTLSVLGVGFKNRASGILEVLKEIRYFVFLFFLIISARSLSTPGSRLFGILGFSVTSEGVIDGVILSWRLALVVMFGFLFTRSTLTSEIKTGVEWFLAPIPFIPQRRAATMISLLVRFMPLILNQVRDTADVQRSRGIENRKNPVYRMSKLSISVIRRVFENADNLAAAMEARCYSGKSTGYAFYARRRDWLTLALVLVLCLTSAVV